jgi:hypothetical protein
MQGGLAHVKSQHCWRPAEMEEYRIQARRRLVQRAGRPSALPQQPELAGPPSTARARVDPGTRRAPARRPVEAAGRQSPPETLADRTGRRTSSGRLADGRGRRPPSGPSMGAPWPSETLVDVTAQRLPSGAPIGVARPWRSSSKSQAPRADPESRSTAPAGSAPPRSQLAGLGGARPLDERRIRRGRGRLEPPLPAQRRRPVAARIAALLHYPPGTDVRAARAPA